MKNNMEQRRPNNYEKTCESLPPKLTIKRIIAFFRGKEEKK